METIYLIRHGKTRANQEGRFCGVTETELLPESKIELDWLKHFFASKKVDKVFVSPSKRAIETASVIHGKPELKVQLMEINFGLFEGHTFAEAEILYPQHASTLQSLRSFDEYFPYSYPEGESLEKSYNRHISIFNDILKTSKPNSTTAIVAHSGTLRSILSYVICGNPLGVWSLKVDNSSISKITSSHGAFVVEFMNLLP